jgi:glycosyltransferase involved in cell wall biosynthesis
MDISAASTNDLHLVCFYTLRKWWDGHLPEGTAGSEEAVVCMARALAKQGWNVTVFNSCLEARRCGDVTYIPLQHYDPCQECAVTVIWRDGQPLGYPLQSKKNYLWMHDIVSIDSWPQHYWSKLTKMIVLSRYHRSTFPSVPEEKIFVSRNGIFPPGSAGFRRAQPRDTRRCIYASGPTRGLQCLLKLWPRIRARVPDATLAVHYGWSELDWNDPESESALEKRQPYVQLLDQPGVVTRNERLDLDRLWEAFEHSGLWIYPTEFNETSCITAMRAQAAGAIPVVTAVAGLKETVKWGTRIEATDIYTNEIAQNNFVAAVVDNLLRPQEELRGRMMTWARRHLSWDEVALEWDREFREEPLQVAGRVRRIAGSGL